MSLLDHWLKPKGFAKISAQKCDQIMKWMKQVPFVFFNLFLLPVPAFASDLIMSDPNQTDIIPSDAPQIFEDVMSIAPEIPQAPEGFENVIVPSANTLNNMMNNVPDGFEMFPAQNEGIFGNLIDLNKQCILQLQDTLVQFGFQSGDSAGLSIISWAFILKLLSTPFYENAIKYPA